MSHETGPELLNAELKKCPENVREWADWAIAHMESLTNQGDVQRRTLDERRENIAQLQCALKAKEDALKSAEELVRSYEKVRDHRKSVNIIDPGTPVYVGPNKIPGTVEEVVIREGRHVFYRVSWWDRSGRHAMQVPACEVKDDLPLRHPTEKQT